jgi:nitrate reductase NapA
MTRRVAELHRAVPEAVLFMHPDDAKARAAAWHAGQGRFAPRRDCPQRRNQRPQQGTARPGVRALLRRRPLINKLTLDATCPISKETDYKKCAVKVMKA